MREGNARFPAGRYLPSPLDAIRYHELEEKTANVLMLVYCKQERIWANFRGPGQEVRPRTDGVLVVSLTALQFKAAFSHLARSGLLGQARPACVWPDSENYTLQFTLVAPKYRGLLYNIDLGTKAQAVECLGTLKKALDGKVAEAISQVLERLEKSSLPTTAPVRN